MYGGTQTYDFMIIKSSILPLHDEKKPGFSIFMFSKMRILHTIYSLVWKEKLETYIHICNMLNEFPLRKAAPDSVTMIGG